MTPEQVAEQKRLAALERLAVLDSLEEQAFDDLTRMAASICQTPIALISLVDQDRQWFKSRFGLQAKETPREFAFCHHAIKAPNDVMVVSDAKLDARFASNPLVTGDPNIRFYAGAPLTMSSGESIGTLCVIDREVRDLTAEQLAQLRFLADQVVQKLEERRAALDGGTDLPG